MSTSGYYKRYADNGWSDDCDTLFKPVFIGETRIGYFRTECRLGNKEGYLSFVPEMMKKFKDGTEWLDFIFDPSGTGYRLSIPVNPGKYFIQRAKDTADQYDLGALLRFWTECLNEYDARKKSNKEI